MTARTSSQMTTMSSLGVESSRAQAHGCYGSATTGEGVPSCSCLAEALAQQLETTLHIEPPKPAESAEDHQADEGLQRPAGGMSRYAWAKRQYKPRKHLSCDVCSKRLSSQSALRDHKRRGVCTKKALSTWCMVCKRSFWSRMAKSRHVCC